MVSFAYFTPTDYRLPTYDGLPVEVDGCISDAETNGSSTDCSSIYAAQFGFQTGLCGLANGGIQVQPLGVLETKAAWRTRIKWCCGLALFRDVALARLEGVRIRQRDQRRKTKDERKPNFRPSSLQRSHKWTTFSTASHSWVSRPSCWSP